MDAGTGKQGPDVEGRIRVLHLIHTLERGGAEQILVSWFKSGGSEQFAYEVCCLFRGGPHEATITKAGIPVHIAGMRNPLDLAGLRRAARIIKQAQPDIIHTQLRYADLVGPLLARWTGCRHVLSTIQNTADHYFEPGLAIGRAEALLYKWGSKLFPRNYVACSEAVAKDIERHMGNKVPVWVVSNAVDCDRLIAEIKHDPQQVRSRLGLPDDALVYISVGRLEYQKGHSDLLQAFTRVKAHSPRAVLLLAGEGSLRSQLEAQADELGLEESVIFLGERSDVPELVNASDVVVCSSLYEGLPVAIAEAMALGAPVLATRVGGVPQLIEAEVRGIVVEPGQVDALAAQMQRLYDDEPLRKRLGEAAKKFIREHFDISLMIQGYEDVYRQMLE